MWNLTWKKFIVICHIWECVTHYISWEMCLLIFRVCVLLLVCYQVFVNGLGETSCGNPTRVISGFPSFHVGDSSSKLGYLAYDDFFVGWMGMGLGRWERDSKVSSIQIWFDEPQRKATLRLSFESFGFISIQTVFPWVFCFILPFPSSS